MLVQQLHCNMGVQSCSRRCKATCRPAVTLLTCLHVRRPREQSWPCCSHPREQQPAASQASLVISSYCSHLAALQQFGSLFCWKLLLFKLTLALHVVHICSDKSRRKASLPCCSCSCVAADMLKCTDMTYANLGWPQASFPCCFT